MTGTYLDPNGLQHYEVQHVRCKASSGTFTLTYRGKTTVPISYSSSLGTFQAAIDALTTISGSYYEATGVTMGSATVCSSSGVDTYITFYQDFGDLPLLVGDSTSLRLALQSAVELTITQAVRGTRENLDCSDRGICSSSSGKCDCSAPFGPSNGNGGSGRRGDCGSTTVPITKCPGIISCSGHGICSGAPTYKCSCSTGFTGADCSLRTCPSGKSWFSLPTADEAAHAVLAECSNMGICNRVFGLCE